MTVHQEPPIVELHEILDERDAETERVTGGQWALVIGGGIVAVAGLLALLVVTSPVLLELVQALHTISQVGSVTP